jgi:DHA2 family multidrug resistance protein
MLGAISFVAMGATCFLRSGFYLDIDFYHVAVAQLLMGVGVALFFMPMLTILLSDLSQEEIAAGSGLATFLRTLGGSFSASLTTMLWTRRAVFHHERLAEHITAYDPPAQAALEQLGKGDLPRAANLLNNMITRQAYQLSFNEVFHVLGWLFFGLVLLIWFARPPFLARASASAGGH